MLVLEAAREATHGVDAAARAHLGARRHGLRRRGRALRRALAPGAWAELGRDAATLDPEWLAAAHGCVPVRAAGRGRRRHDAEHPGQPAQQPARPRGPGFTVSPRRRRASSRSTSPCARCARRDRRGPRRRGRPVARAGAPARRSRRSGTRRARRRRRGGAGAQAPRRRAARRRTRSRGAAPRTRPPRTLALGDDAAGSTSARCFGSCPRRHRAAARRRGCARPAPPRATARSARAADALVRRAHASRSRSRRSEAPPRAARLARGDRRAWLLDAPPRLHVFSRTRSRGGVLAALAARRRVERRAGPAGARRGRRRRARGARRRGAPLARAWRAAARGRRLPRDARSTASWRSSSPAPPPPTPAWAASSRSRLPELVDAVAARCDRAASRSTDWLYGAGDGEPRTRSISSGASSFVCQLHAELTRGCSGSRPRRPSATRRARSNALFAMGAWTDLDAMMPREPRRARSSPRELVGAFEAPRRAWAAARPAGDDVGRATSCSAPVEQVQRRARRRAARSTSPSSTRPRTASSAARRARASASSSAARRASARSPLGYDIAAHCPEVDEVRDAWWRCTTARRTDVARRALLHARDRRLVPADRRGRGRRDHRAGGAHARLPAPRRAAWADGVRVFVEHGPRGLCTGWIRRILGERDAPRRPARRAGPLGRCARR